MTALGTFTVLVLMSQQLMHVVFVVDRICHVRTAPWFRMVQAGPTLVVCAILTRRTTVDSIVKGFGEAQQPPTFATSVVATTTASFAELEEQSVRQRWNV